MGMLRESESGGVFDVALPGGTEAAAVLAAIFEHVPEGITVAAAPDATIQLVSRYGRELTGRPLGTLVGIPADAHPEAWDVYHADGTTRATAEELPLTRATRHGEVVRNEEWVLRRADGAAITVLCNAGPIRDATGAITGGVIAWRDIDERKAWTRHLERQRAFGIALGEAVTVADIGAVVTRELPALFGADVVGLVRPIPAEPEMLERVAILGLDEAAQAGWARFPRGAPTPPADAIRTAALVEIAGWAALHARYPDSAEAVERAGLRHWLAVPCLLGERSEPRAVGCLVLAFRDVQALDPYARASLLSLARLAGQALERARLFEAEQAARARTERLLAATRSLAEVTTAAGVTATVADTGAAVMGADMVAVYIREASPDGALLRLVSEVGLEAVTRAAYASVPLEAPIPLCDVVRTGVPILIEDAATLAARYPHLVGDVARSGLVAMLVLPLRLGRVAIGSLAFAYAAPRRLSVEEQALAAVLAEQCAQALERVRLLEEANAARLRAEQASRAKGEFLANLSHELRTPLTAISGHVHLLTMGLHGPLATAQGEALARIQAAGGRMVTLLNDVLDHAKVEAGMVAFREEAVDLVALREEVGRLVEPQRLAKGLDWVTPAADAPCVARADPDRVMQVLLNLVANAIKFTHEGGRLTIALGADAGSAWIEVTDTGIGIAPDRLAAVFDPFVQVTGGTDAGAGGTGLGLTISRDLARGMGGELTATSTVGVGSTFRLVLPATDLGDRP